MVKLGKVARPRTAVADVVPDSVPPPGLSPITTVTNPVNLDTTFTGLVTVVIGDNPGGGTLSGTTSATAVRGLATFPNLTIDKVATGYTLTFSSAGLLGVTSLTFTIPPAAASQLVFTVQPTTTVAGDTITPAVEVTARDAFGNVATGFAGADPRDR